MTSEYARPLNDAIAEIQRLIDCGDATSAFVGLGEMLNTNGNGGLRRHLLAARTLATRELVRKYGSAVAVAARLGVSQTVVSRAHNPPDVRTR